MSRAKPRMRLAIVQPPTVRTPRSTIRLVWGVPAATQSPRSE
jgi:hypothetical protein